MSTRRQSSGARPSLPKPNSAGLLRELIMWPLLVFGAGGFAVLFGAHQVVIGLAFILSIGIIITTTGSQRVAACWAMVVFGVVNGVQIHFPTEAMSQQPEFWFANRLLYAVGLPFYFTPILGDVFSTEKGRVRGLVVAPVLLLVAYIAFVLQRAETVGTQAWYTPAMLYDDLFVGLASGLVHGALTAHSKAKKKTKKQTS